MGRRWRTRRVKRKARFRPGLRQAQRPRRRHYCVVKRKSFCLPTRALARPGGRENGVAADRPSAFEAVSGGRERARSGRLLRLAESSPVGFKEVAHGIIAAAMSIPWFARLAGPVLIGYYESRWGRHDAEWSRKHPFDQLHGVDTSGFVPGFLLTLGFSAYAAAQPGIIRKALIAIPEPQQCRFLDLGCGKGRPLLVATEFGFPAITGVEVSPGLARIARRNAGILANAHPDRTRINIVTADATKYRLPAESLVIFLYNPFEGPLVARLLGNIEVSLLQSPRTLYIVYYNPVFAGILDASPAL